MFSITRPFYRAARFQFFVEAKPCETLRLQIQYDYAHLFSLISFASIPSAFMRTRGQKRAGHVQIVVLVVSTAELIDKRLEDPDSPYYAC